MAGEALTLEGLEAAIRAIDGLGSAGHVLVRRSLTKGLRVPFRRAKMRDFGFTDRTGRLRRSIKIKGARRRSRDEVVAELTAGGRGAKHAWLVERRRSYLVRAVEETQDELFRVVVEEMGRSLRVVVAGVS